MQTLKECFDFIYKKVPIYSHSRDHKEVKYEVYEYDDISDLVYDKFENGFFFVAVRDRSIKSPLLRSFHRLDGPSHIVGDNMIAWYLNDTNFRTFDRWAKAARLSNNEKVKMKLKYGNV